MMRHTTGHQNGAIEALVSRIQEFHPRIEALIERLRVCVAAIEAGLRPGEVRTSAALWRSEVCLDALIRIRLFIEQNLGYIEPTGLLGVTRYMFELTIWLKLLEKDAHNAALYYYELHLDQLEHYVRWERQIEREIEFLKGISQRESGLLKKRAAERPDIANASILAGTISQAIADAVDKIDADAARRFSVYGEQAIKNGYGLQAHLVETQDLPRARQSISAIEEELGKCDEGLRREFKRHRTNWRQKAADVGMVDEYDFIYSFTSRILHATPASLTTDLKNLEPDEIRLLLRYVRVRVLDAVEFADRLLAGAP